MKYKLTLGIALITVFQYNTLKSEAPKVESEANVKPASGFVLDANIESIPIILGPNAGPNTVQATEELRRLLSGVFGKAPQLLKDSPSKPPEHAIWIGMNPNLKTIMPEVDFSLKKPEEILIVSANGHLAILGDDEMIGENQTKSGTANAIYTFLQKYVGVRWLWPGALGEVLPSKTLIPIETGVFRFAPAFLQRDIFYGEKGWSPEVREWCMRQRLLWDSLEAPNSHSFYTWWDKYHLTHPEYFAMQPDGTRNGYPSPRNAKVCEAEPAVWQRWLEDVSEQRQANPLIKVFGASQNDSSNSGICMDPRSKAWDHPDGPLQQYIWQGKVEKYPAMSDRMVRFLNTLGQLLEERFPNEDLQVMGMAYGPSKPAPIEAVPGKNVVIGYVGQFPTAGNVQRELEKAQFAEWAKKAHSMVFRPNLFYYSGGWHGLPVITPHLIEEDFRFLADHNCRGILVDGAPQHWGTQGLQYYIMAQLAWDPYRNADELVKEFCELGFGPAAETMKVYFALMVKAQMATLNHPEWVASMGVVKNVLSERILPEAYSEALLDEADSLISRARQEVSEGNPVYTRRVEFIARSQEFNRLMMKTLLVMNRVRNSGGRNYEAVDQAQQLVKAREDFFAKDELDALKDRRPTAVNAHRIRTTWIEARKLQDWLGPVKEDFLIAANQAKKMGNPTQTPDANGIPKPSSGASTLATPKTLRWNGKAKDMSWLNKSNWEALTENGSWIPSPIAPDESTTVLLGDIAGKASEEVLRIGRDTSVESILITALSARTVYRIESRPDDTGGIDADSSRLYVLTITGDKPIVQKPETKGKLVIDLELRLSNPEAQITRASESKAEIILPSMKTPTKSHIQN